MVNKKVTDQMRAEAGQVVDPQRKKDILDSIAELESFLPRQINAVKGMNTSLPFIAHICISGKLLMSQPDMFYP